MQYQYTALSLRFNGHFPGGPGLAGTRMSSFWILLELRVTEVVSGDNRFNRQSTTGRRLHQLPQLPFRVGTDEFMPVSVIRDLGINIDSDVSTRSHVAKTVSACFAVLRQLRSIRQSVPRSVLQSLVTSLVLTRLDYGNATLVGIPQSSSIDSNR